MGNKKNNNRNYNKKKVVLNNNKQTNTKNNQNKKNQNSKNKTNYNRNNQNKSNQNKKNQPKNNNNIEKNKVVVQKKVEQESAKTIINSHEIDNPNSDLTKVINNNIVDNTILENNALEKKLILDEEKKKDIGKIYDRYQTNLGSSKSYGWKVLSFILFLVIIALSITLIMVIGKPNDSECKAVDNPPTDLDNPQDNPSNDKEERYLFLGDSLFWQYNTDEFFKDYNIINSGTNGITALDTLNVIEENVYAHNPTSVFILLGTNDLYHGYNVQETIEHLQNLVNKIHNDKPDIKINILSLLPINKTDNSKISKEANNNKTNEQILEVNNQLQAYCEEKSFTYINVHDILIDENGNLKLDYTREGLHITDLGYHQITMELLKYIKK